MKLKILIVVMTVVILAGVGPVSASDVVLARGGAAVHVIALAPDATPPERHAAEELASFLKQVTGAAFPIKPPAEAAGAPCLAVGPGAARAIQPDLALDGLGADGIVIRGLPGKHLLLTGGVGAPRGTLYAVYTFLENEVGCRWWTRTESSIPNKPTLAVKDNLNLRYVPPLEFRDQSFNEGMDGVWAVRHKFNGWCGPGDSVLRGGSLMFAGNGNHTFFSLVPPKEHFDKHPEWYAEINGKRTVEGQLCLTNPELLRFVIGRVKAWLKEAPFAQIKPAFVSVSQNDCAGWCTCPRCKAVDEEEGSQSGTMIRFVNAVAEGIEPDYPNVAVDTFAYQYSRKPPKLVRPRKNVVVRLCSIECDFAHPLDDDRNLAFRKDLDGWYRICDRLYIWDYATNFRYFFQAHPNLRVLGPNIRFFVRTGVKGVFEQGGHESPGTPFGALRAWVIGKLLWNPALNDRALIEEFLDGYYGPAAPALRRYIDLIHDTMAQSGYRLSMFAPSNAPYVAPKILARSATLVAEAKAAVAGQQEFLRRVEIVEMSILFSQILQACDRLVQGDEIADEQALRQLDRFAAVAQREKITRISEGGEGDLDKWVRRVRHLVSGAGRQQTAWTDKGGKGEVAVVRLASFWRFAPDPKDVGVKESWFARDKDDAAWVMNRTDVEYGWEQQGFPGYTGLGWYRQKFDLPANLKGKRLYLYFEAVDEEGWIYLNGDGKTAFEHTCAGTGLKPEQIWLTPFLFEATGRLRPGQANLLAVRVNNTSSMGGIWRPVYVVASEADLTLREVQEAVREEPKTK